MTNARVVHRRLPLEKAKTAMDPVQVAVTIAEIQMNDPGYFLETRLLTQTATWTPMTQLYHRTIYGP